MGWGIRITTLAAAFLLAASCQPQPPVIDLAAIASEAQDFMGLSASPDSVIIVAEKTLQKDIWSLDEGVYFRIRNGFGVVDRLFVPRDPKTFDPDTWDDRHYTPLDHGVWRYENEG